MNNSWKFVLKNYSLNDYDYVYSSQEKQLHDEENETSAMPHLLVDVGSHDSPDHHGQV